MFIDDLNNAVQKQVFVMLKAKEEYDKQVAGGKLKFHRTFDLSGLFDLNLDNAAKYLLEVKHELASYEIGNVDISEYDGMVSVDYYWYESDDDYAERIEKLANNLAEKRAELEKAERTRDFYLNQ